MRSVVVSVLVLWVLALASGVPRSVHAAPAGSPSRHHAHRTHDSIDAAALSGEDEVLLRYNDAGEVVTPFSPHWPLSSLSARHPRGDYVFSPIPEHPAPNAKKLAGSRPNIIFIMVSTRTCITRKGPTPYADDSGYGDVGAYGYGADTPFLDKLAAQSLLMTDYHSGASVCTPSRASLLTGRLGLRTGVTDNFWPESLAGLALNETTIAELLKQANYTTAILGKWHLGHADQYHPSYRGFDQTFSLPYSVDMGCNDGGTYNTPIPSAICPKDPWLDEASMALRMFSAKTARRRHLRDRSGEWSDPPDVSAPGLPLYDTSFPNCASSAAEAAKLEQIESKGVAGPHSVAACNAHIVQQPVNISTLSDHYANKTSTWLKGWAADQRAARAQGQTPTPFFLYVPLSHMHVPHGYDSRFVNISRQRTIYGDTLREMDWQISKLYETLLHEGLEKDTLLIYTSDNGPWSVKCSYAGNVGPFSGVWQHAASGGGGGGTAKFTTWEAGTRVPMIAHWPGHIRPGSRSAALASHLDMLPTFLALAGASLPTNKSFDGADLSPVLFDGKPNHAEALFHPSEFTGVLSAVRFHQYKFFWTTYGVDDCNQTSPVPPSIDHAVPLVFDLSADPTESTPLTNVDPRLYARAEELRAAKLADIYSTPRTNANFAEGTTADWPCCDPQHVVCRCTD